jgi:hypothetical protein
VGVGTSVILGSGVGVGVGSSGSGIRATIRLKIMLATTTKPSILKMIRCLLLRERFIAIFPPQGIILSFAHLR